MKIKIKDMSYWLLLCSLLFMDESYCETKGDSLYSSAAEKYNYRLLAGFEKSSELEFVHGRILGFQNICACLKTTTLFTNSNEVVIIANEGNEQLIERHALKCKESFSFKFWIVNEKLSKQSIRESLEWFMQSNIKKFILFTSFESTSMFLAGIENSYYGGVEKPIAFIYDQRFLYFSLDIPSHVVAVEVQNERTGPNVYVTYSLYSLQLSKPGWIKFGMLYNISEEIQFVNEYARALKGYPSFFATRNKAQVYRVAALDEPPFVTVQHYDPSKGICSFGKICIDESNSNEIRCCHGFLIDFIRILEREMFFESQIYLVKDKKYGELFNGSWVGLIGELVSDKADIALAPLTLHQKRSKAVDFTVPFIMDGMSLITKAKEEHIPFLNIEPLKSLSIHLWFVTVTIPVLVVLLLFYTDKSLGKTYQLKESFTYVTGLLFQKDTGGKIPKNWSSKIISISVALFTLIIMSSYTAVLTANSVLYTESLPITGFDDAKIQNPSDDFKYGTVANSAFTETFRNSDDAVLRRMSRFMKKYNFVNSTDAFQKLANGELHAIIHGYAVGLYHIEKDTECRFKFSGGMIKDAGSGIAVRKGSHLVNEISNVILLYQENGLFVDLTKKWIPMKCMTQPKLKAGEEATKLGVYYFGGLFILLMGFILLCFFIVFLNNILSYINKLT